MLIRLTDTLIIRFLSGFIKGSNVPFSTRFHVCARARVCRSDCVCVWCARACIILFIMKEIFSAVNKFVENKNANHQHGKPSFQPGNSDGIIHPS